MNNKEIIERLRVDEDYYGAFGQQFLSNSNIGTLFNNPSDLRVPTPDNPNFKVGGYFHTKILEPDKLGSFDIIDATTRNTSKYKEESKGKICLLQHEVDNLNIMVDTLMNNAVCKELVKPLLGSFTYEEPAITELFGNQWKGKADIVNHDEKLVIDLKTTGDISRFRWSASRYNYDSQAYIYRALFGYDMLFLAVDKKTHQLGLFECSEAFYKSGEDKVKRASEIYTLFYKDKDFDPKQHVTSDIL